MAHAFEALKTVLAGMLGVRRKSSHVRASELLNPVQLVITAVVVGAVFVATLVVIVSFVVD